MKAEGKKSRTVFPDPRLLCPRRSVRPCHNEEQTRTSLSQLVVEQEFRSSLVTHACQGAEAFPSSAVLCDGACQIPLAPDPRCIRTRRSSNRTTSFVSSQHQRDRVRTRSVAISRPLIALTLARGAHSRREPHRLCELRNLIQLALE
jgi:hypothetical protein